MVAKKDQAKQRAGKRRIAGLAPGESRKLSPMEDDTPAVSIEDNPRPQDARRSKKASKKKASSRGRS